MRIAAAFAALLLLACPLSARAAAPASSCPDVLLGDSLAVGMGPYARAAGFQVIARTGIGLAWLRAQSPRCARRVVVVIGTNDLRGIDPYSAEAYPARLAAIMSRWQTQQIIWATPGCFPYDQSLERGSEALDRALTREPLVRVGSGRDYMRVHSGRTARCSYLSGDGIHPTGAGYRAWWAGLSHTIGPAPEGETAPEARTLQVASARPSRARTTPRLVWQGSATPPRAGTREARTTRQGRAVQQARTTGLRQAARQAQATRPSRTVRQAQTARRTAPVAQARAVQQTRPVRLARPASSAHGAREARTAAQLRATRDAQAIRRPATRLTAATPTRRT